MTKQFSKRSLGPLFAGALLSLPAFISSSSAAQKGIDLSDLNAWRKPSGEWMAAKAVALDPSNAEKFVITPGKGILVNGPKGKTGDLISEQEFGDIEAHVEFCVPKHSN